MSIDYKQSPSCNGSWLAGLDGAGKGILNLVGAGALIPSDNQAQEDLQAAQTSLSVATTEWNKAIADEKAVIVTDRERYLRQLITFSSDQQSVINEMLGEKIQTNSLLIGMTVILIIFLILYDIL